MSSMLRATSSLRTARPSAAFFWWRCWQALNSSYVKDLVVCVYVCMCANGGVLLISAVAAGQQNNFKYTAAATPSTHLSAGRSTSSVPRTASRLASTRCATRSVSCRTSSSMRARPWVAICAMGCVLVGFQGV